MGNDGTQWPDGQYTMTATGRRRLQAIRSPSRPRSEARSAPSISPRRRRFLTINGQSYTISQVKSIGVLAHDPYERIAVFP